MTQQMKFTKAEAVSLFCVAFIFQAFNEVITISVREAGNAAWISQAVSGFLAVGVLFLYLLLFRRFEGKSLLEIIDEVFGRVAAKAMHLLLMVYFTLMLAVTLHEMVMLLRSFAYAEVGPLFLCIILMAITCVVCRHPVKGLAMTTSIFLPAFLLLMLGIVALTAPQFNLHYLTPLLGYGPVPIARQSFYLVSNFENIVMIAVFLPSFGGTKQFQKSAIVAIIIACACLLAVTLSYCLMFPYYSVFQNSSAMLNMTQSVYINRFLQRFESAFVAGVTSSVILVLCVKMMALRETYCHLFRIRSEHANTVLYPLAVGIILATEALAALNAHENSYRGVAHRYSAFFVTGLAVVCLLVCLLRRKGARRSLRATALLLVPCFIALTFSGCGGYHEPDEETYPVIMGYDRGETEKYRLTFRYMLGKEAEGTPDVNTTLAVDENGDPPPEIFIVEAPSALMALDYISALVPKRYSLMHINMIVISEDLAREDLDVIVSPIIRHKETKNTMAFLITRGSAQDTVMQPTGKMDSSLPMFIESVLEARNGITTYDTVTIKDVYSHFEDGYGDSLAMYAGYEGYDTEDKPFGFFVLGEDGAAQAPADSYSYHPDAGASGESSEAQSSAPPDEVSTTGITPESDEEEPGQDSEESGGGGEQAETNEKTTPTGMDETVPMPNRPAAEQLRTELSRNTLHGFVPGQVPVRSSAKMEIAGMAVLRNKNMVGYIDSRENSVHMMLKGNFLNGYYYVADPHQDDSYVVFRMHNRQPTKVYTEIDGDGTAHIRLEVYLKGRLTMAQNTEMRYTDPGHRKELEEYTAQVIEEEAVRLINKLQQQYSADTLNLGKHIAGEFLTIPEWEAYDWRSQYPNAQITVDVNFKL